MYIKRFVVSVIVGASFMSGSESEAANPVFSELGAETCCGQHVELLCLVSGDYSAQEKQDIADSLNFFHGDHISIIGEATLAYNCHGYVFHESAYWLHDPSQWFGAASPCYRESNGPGPVVRWITNNHTAKCFLVNNNGTPLSYKAKLGPSCLAFHDDTVSLYGAPEAHWEQR